MRTSQAASNQKRSSTIFEAWGRLVCRWRWAVLVGAALLLGLSGFALRSGGSLSNGSPGSSSLEASRAQSLINQELVSGQPSGSSFQLIFGSQDRPATDPAFRSQVESALAPIQHDPRVTALQTPYNAPTPAIAHAFISGDGREALVQVELKHSGNQAVRDHTALRAMIQASDLAVTPTTPVPVNNAFNTTLESDLRRAEMVSLPLALILLLLIFGSVVAAGLPLAVRVLTILAGLAGTFLLARTTEVSQYALNVVTLIGLGVVIDYSLFVVNRFRDERLSGASREDAVAKTVATAGRTITFSGLIVVIGLPAMLFYQGTSLASMGSAGAMAVAAAVFYALTFLPALLTVLGPRVDRLHYPSGAAGRPRAVMCLLGDYNWWAPHPPRALHSWAGLGEAGARPLDEPA